MPTIQTQNKELLVVEVPEDALEDRWFIVYNVKRNSFSVEFQTNKDNIYVDLKTDKDCYILGKLSELSEEECSRFVEFAKHFYKDYLCKYNVDLGLQYKLTDAKESLISLLQSHGVNTENQNTLLLIEKL